MCEWNIRFLSRKRNLLIGENMKACKGVRQARQYIQKQLYTIYTYTQKKKNSQREKKNLCLDEWKSVPPDVLYTSNQCSYNLCLRL